MRCDGIEVLRERLGKFQRMGSANLPTPLQRLDRLSEFLGGPTIWVKREDLTGLGMGGNKVRKLDYLLREAVNAGCDTVVSGFGHIPFRFRTAAWHAPVLTREGQEPSDQHSNFPTKTLP